MRTRSALLVIGLACLVGCGSADITIGTSDMWVRPTAPGATNAAFYGTITNNGDTSMGFEAGESLACERIEVHESSMQDGVMSMAPANSADTQLDPGASLVLEPLGLHIMCIGLSEPLVEGETIELELTFSGAETQVVEVDIDQR